jgi:hypothetical protein
MHRFTYIDYKKDLITYGILNMLFVLYVCGWRNILEIQYNDPTHNTRVLNHILLICSHKMYLYKYLIPSYISLWYISFMGIKKL